MNNVVPSSSKPVLPETIGDLANLLQAEMAAAAQELLSVKPVLDEASRYFVKGASGNGGQSTADETVIVLQDPKPLYDNLVARTCRPGQAYMKGAAFHPSVSLPKAASSSPETCHNGNGVCQRTFSVAITYNQSPFGTLEVTIPYRRDRFELGNVQVRGIPPSSASPSPQQTI
ncbi:hypothetical protein HYS47_02440 [Candidatus Woesearchaeota archaeon]|nr:hypothetical protein [Candidatus Woesearchaeota archaeon]